MKNPYYERSRLAAWKFRQLAHYFVMDLSATDAAALTGLSRKTVTTIFLKLRQRIVRECEREGAHTVVDDANDAPPVVSPQAPEGAMSEMCTLFGVVTRDGLIRTRAVAGGNRATPQAVINGRALRAAPRDHEVLRDYEALIDLRRLKLFRVNRQLHAAGDGGGAHFNSVESFWSFAKRRLQKFNGVAQHTSYLHVKECEWRFNLRHRDLYRELLKLLRVHPL